MGSSLQARAASLTLSTLLSHCYLTWCYFRYIDMEILSYFISFRYDVWNNNLGHSWYHLPHNLSHQQPLTVPCGVFKQCFSAWFPVLFRSTCTLVHADWGTQKTENFANIKTPQSIFNITFFLVKNNFSRLYSYLHTKENCLVFNPRKTFFLRVIN